MTRSLADLVIGEEHVSLRRRVTESDVVQYVHLSGDDSALVVPPHSHGAEHIVPDLLSFILQFGLGSKAIQPPVSTIALLGVEWEFHRMVHIGDHMRVRTTLVDKSVTSKGLGKLTWRREIYCNDELAQTGVAVNLVRNGTTDD
jgi:acyl dehydratase